MASSQPVGQDFQATASTRLPISSKVVEEKNSLVIRELIPTRYVAKENGIHLCEYG